MRLVDLVGGERVAQAVHDTDIIGLTSDSRRVEPGFLFAALPGTRVHGGAFIPQALERGAAAVLAPGRFELPADSRAQLLVDDNPRRRFALMAARFFGAQPETVAAITGTNGKTRWPTSCARSGRAWETGPPAWEPWASPSRGSGPGVI